ncbi:MAG: hypothetical protein H6822_35865 [Planctomycetaceae bacterium]|nr:hypothetical protein [Planctomycetales bacterium]MCB9927567.1 hypothetical protein [Planctomycetaceae bacterium]
MVRKYALYGIAHWLRINREQRSKVSLDEVNERGIREGLTPATAISRESGQAAGGRQSVTG